MNVILDKVDILIEEYKSLLPMENIDRERLDKKFRLEFNYNSNHLEGNTLTYSETQLLLLQNYVGSNHSMRELEEMIGHDYAYYMVKDWAKNKDRPLTESDIKELNQTILVRPFWKDAITRDRQKTKKLINVGVYKNEPNSVLLNNGELFEYVSVADTPIEMASLIEWYLKEKNSLHPIILAAQFHHKFVLIHPFDDGNGRISRLLMNYILLDNELPPIVVKSKDKKNYLTSLRLADVGNMESFINYLSNQLIWSLELSINAAKGFDIEEVTDIEKEITLWKRNNDNLSTPVVKKTDDLIAEIFIKRLVSLFSEYEEKMTMHFKELFSDWELNGVVNTSNKSNEGTKFLIERVNKMIKDIRIKNSTPYIDGISSSIKSAGIEINMRGYNKDKSDIIEYSSFLSVEFQDLKYFIKLNDKEILSKTYSQHIDSADEESIIQLSLKELFTIIKNSFNPF